MKRKEHINIGRIMTILSVKHWETPALRKLKARIVFRGDGLRDNEGNLAVLLESKVNPTGMAGINANIAYGSLPVRCCPCLPSVTVEEKSTNLGWAESWTGSWWVQTYQATMCPTMAVFVWPPRGRVSLGYEFQRSHDIFWCKTYRYLPKYSKVTSGFQNINFCWVYTGP